MAARAAIAMNELRIQGLLDKMRPARTLKENPERKPGRKPGKKTDMIPWTLIDSAKVPGTAEVPDGDTGEMRLYRRGTEYSIRVGAYELMNNRVHGSEDALASIVCERLNDRDRPIELAIAMLVQQLDEAFALKRRTPRQQRVKHDAERKNVGPYFR